jgi:hypothetical protein
VVVRCRLLAGERGRRLWRRRGLDPDGHPGETDKAGSDASAGQGCTQAAAGAHAQPATFQTDGAHEFPGPLFADE